MSAKAEVLGNLVDLIANQYHPYDPQALPGPGILVRNNGTSSRAIAVKAPCFRPAGTRYVEGSYEADVVPIVNAIFEEPKPIGNRRLKGVEVELQTVDADGQPADLHPSDTPIDESLGRHPELFRSIWETDYGPDEDVGRLYAGVRKEISRIASILSWHDLHIDPASARMQDRPGKNDITPNAYVQTMAELFGEGIHKLLGTGIHEHYDVHVGYSPIVARYLRVLAPYLNAGLQAAPFAFGEHTPHLGEILDNDELRQYDGTQPHSVRYLIRFAAIENNGGVGLRVVHDTLDEALEDAHRQLQRGYISNPARLHGAHADVRSRFDPPSPDMLDHPGRLELCVKDTGALRFETLEAYCRLASAVVDVLEEVATGGEQAVAQLHQEFPQLFGTNYDKQTFGTVQLDRTHRNSVAIAYHGNDAMVENGLGITVPLARHFGQVLRFVQGRLALKQIATLHDSLLSPDALPQTYKKYTDKQGLPSLTGYYATGKGTAADWMIARNEAMVAQGLRSEQDRMRNGTQDRMQAIAKDLLRTAVMH